MFSADDHRFMARALQLAELGRYSTHPNPRVGCLIVKDGLVVGEGFHARPGEPHAEIHALQQAADKARGATAYVTLEPCSHHGRTPPCAEALVEAGVSKVIAAMKDPNPQVSGSGLAHLRKNQIETHAGLLEAEARALNPGFVSRMSRGRPWVRLKLAGSLDARTAMASGESSWITGPAAREDVQRLRAQADAIVTGVETVLHDDPSLNVRFRAPEQYSRNGRQPLRVILDSHLRTPVTARTLRLAGDVLILCSDTVSLGKRKALEEAGAEVLDVTSVAGRLSLNTVIDVIARRDINECHLECGATLAGAFLQAQLVDELVYYMAPVLMGSDARPLAKLPLNRMAEKIEFDLQDLTQVGRDLRLTLRPA